MRLPVLWKERFAKTETSKYRSWLHLNNSLDGIRYKKKNKFSNFSYKSRSSFTNINVKMFYARLLILIQKWSTLVYQYWYNIVLRYVDHFPQLIQGNEIKFIWAWNMEHYPNSCHSLCIINILITKHCCFSFSFNCKKI